MCKDEVYRQEQVENVDAIPLMNLKGKGIMIDRQQDKFNVKEVQI